MKPSPLANVATPNMPAAVTILEITDPTAVGEAVELIEQDAVQLDSKPLRARRIVVRLGTSRVVFQSTNRSIRTRTRLLPGFVAFTVFGPRSAGTINGMPVGPNRMFVCMPGIEVEFVVSAGYESVAFLLRPEDVQAHLWSSNRKSELLLNPSLAVLTESRTARGLYNWGHRLTGTAARYPDLFEQLQIQSAAQVELLENLMETLSSAVHCKPDPHDLTRQVYSRVVQTAEDFALNHPVERIYMTDPCEAAGVSERSLQYAFKEVMGMTPVSYLTRLRLHRVRRALRVATKGSTTVTAEALKWGFWHFGDFSRAYKACFAELPSETLRRGPAEG